VIDSLYYPFKKWSQNAAIWLYSDPHFGDFEAYTFRGLPTDKTKEELDKFQVDRINKFVNKNDTIIFLGDIGDPLPLKKIKGHKVLITGNHDRGAAFYKEYFDEIYTGALIIGEKLILSHEPVDIPWLFNIHGHDHSGAVGRKNHLNVCSDVIDYDPINLNQIMKTGLLSKTESIHRLTIDEATERKKKRGGKKIAKTASKASS
jgi:calcineurin-like phosphoesterase family protein